MYQWTFTQGGTEESSKWEHLSILARSKSFFLTPSWRNVSRIFKPICEDERSRILSHPSFFLTSLSWFSILSSETLLCFQFVYLSKWNFILIQEDFAFPSTFLFLHHLSSFRVPSHHPIILLYFYLDAEVDRQNFPILPHVRSHG